MNDATSFSGIFNRPALAVLGACIFVAGCGGGGNGGTNGRVLAAGSPGSPGSSGPPDTSIPTVTAMTPREDTAETGINERITLSFSEGMAPADINVDNFRLTDGTNAISGVVSFDPVNHVAIFAPTVNLQANTRYTATIVTGIKDLGGNPLMTDFAWCFETSGAADTTAPSVTSMIPANAAVGVAVNRNVVATFSENMDSFTLTPASVRVTGPGAAPVSGTVYYQGRTATFSPAQNFAPNTLYTATIGTAVTDLAGNAALANKTWEFTTDASADLAAPVVNSSLPASGASGVAIEQTLQVTFSEPMDPVTVTTQNFTVTEPASGPVIGTVHYDVNSNTATFTRINHLTTPVSFHPVPASNLELNTTYTATLTTGMTDLAGNPLAQNTVWSFTTVP